MKSTRWWQVGCGILAIVGASAALADGPGAMQRFKKAVAGAKLSLPQALEAAQKEVAGGKVFELELEWEMDPAYFSANVLVGEKVKEVQIDPAGGKVLAIAEAKLGEADTKELAKIIQALAAAKVTTVAAIEAAAEEVKGGRAIGIELEEKGAQPSYAVTLLQGEKLITAYVDATGGKVTKTEAAPSPVALWTFDQTEVGRTPSNLIAKETHLGAELGQWKAAADPTAPSKPNVLTLTTHEPDAVFNLALFDNTAYKDLDLRVRIRANAGKVDGGGGLIWRCKDENNYYVCRLNPLEGNFRLYKVSGGKRSQFQSAQLKAETGTWYELRAVMVGDHIACYVNGRKYMEIADDTFKDAGLIGLWTKADASSSFDNLAVYAPAGPLPAPSAKANDE